MSVCQDKHRSKVCLYTFNKCRMLRTWGQVRTPSIIVEGISGGYGMFSCTKQVHTSALVSRSLVCKLCDLVCQVLILVWASWQKGGGYSPLEALPSGRTTLSKLCFSVRFGRHYFSGVEPCCDLDVAQRTAEGKHCHSCKLLRRVCKRLTCQAANYTTKGWKHGEKVILKDWLN